MSYKLPPEYEDAFQRQRKEMEREPTSLERAVFKLAMEDAESKYDVAQFISGEIPGWLYRQPFDLLSPFASAPSDVYLYVDVPEKRRFTNYQAAYEWGDSFDFPLKEELLIMVSGAFMHGAQWVEIRPVKELEQEL